MSNQEIIWGATPADWTMLADVAGVTEDLLPCVCRPGVPVSPNSKLVDYLKVPSLYTTAGHVAGIKDWSIKRSAVRDIDRWQQQPDYGICLQTRDVRAIDIDIDNNPELVAKIRAVFEKHVGQVPVRYRSSATRAVLAFRISGAIGYRVHKTEHGNIEFLADGKQFIAVGTHKSGARYEWEGGLPMDFPKVERDAFENAWAELTMVVEGETKISPDSRTGEMLLVGEGADDTDVVSYLREQGMVLGEGSGKLYITCPFESQHGHASKDMTATSYLPAGTGAYARGHFKCQHDSCAKYNDGDFLGALGVVQAQFDVVELSQDEAAADALVPEFKRGEQGKIMVNLRNAMMALRAPEWCGVEIAMDTFRDELMITPTGKHQWRQFTDADYARLRLHIEGKGLPLGVELIKEAVGLRADENKFDSAMLWLTEEVPEWDGVARVESFYNDVFGTGDTPYARALGRYTWTALAGRVLDPGCKIDMVPILRGGQGLGKSRAVAAIVPSHEFFVELDLSDRDDNMSRLMRGRLVAELGELKGLHNRDVEAIKAFITRRYENWIPKYREFAITFPRRLLFIGTTNRHEFLADDTGNRRWLPIEVTRADADMVERNRMQLWAEARELWRASGVQYHHAESLATDEHDQYRIIDSWEDVIREWLVEFDDLTDGPHEDRPLRSHDVLVGALRMDPKHIKRSDEMRLGTVMASIGFIRKVRRVGGHNAKVWVKG